MPKNIKPQFSAQRQFSRLEEKNQPIYVQLSGQGIASQIENNYPPVGSSRAYVSVCMSICPTVYCVVRIAFGRSFMRPFDFK